MKRSVVIGVDFGGTTVAGGLVGTGGLVLAHLREPTHGAGPATPLDTLLDLVERLLAIARAREVDVTGVGIGVPGAVDAERGALGLDVYNVPTLAAIPLASLVAERVGIPVFVDNDVNVLALGEWMFGAGIGARSLVVLAVGTGVGGGIILDGHLVRGHSGFGGELGHVPIKYDGRPCICGGRGCLKAYVSGPDIALEGSQRLGREVTAAEVFRRAVTGEAAAQEIVTEVCRALGAGLAVIVNGLNPERLIVAGGVADSLKPLEREILACTGRHAFAQALATTSIHIIALDKSASFRGGAALVYYETQRRTCR